MLNNNKKIGNFGEQLACDFLRKRGYKIIERNCKISYEEIDIIAEEGDVLVFVEVKTRISQYYGDGSEAVAGVKQQRLNQAIQKYLDKYKLWHREPRCDLITIFINKATKSAKIEHFKDIL
ncbi:MAG: YraN family protein [Patescibacteria group bacterium]